MFNKLNMGVYLDYRKGKGTPMKSEDNKLIFNKRDHNGDRYISKTTFTLNFKDKDIKVVFSLN